MFSLPQAIENSRQFLLLRTDILQKSPYLVAWPKTWLCLLAKLFSSLSFLTNEANSRTKWRRVMFNDYFSLICFATAQINVTNCCVMQRNRKAHKWICLCRSFSYSESGATYCTTILVETFLFWTRVTTATTDLFKQYQNVKDAFVMMDQAFLICGLRSRVRWNWCWKEGFLMRK